MNKKRLIQILKQFLIVIIVFSLVFPVNLSAKKKRGAKLWVTKLSGEKIKGELLRVKVDEGTLLLMTSAAKTGANININDVYKIRIRKKSKRWAVPVVTITVGLVAGIFGGGGERNWTLLGMAFFGIVFGIPAGVVVMQLGGLPCIDRKFKVEGKAETKKKRILWRLEKVARFKN